MSPCARHCNGAAVPSGPVVIDDVAIVRGASVLRVAATAAACAVVASAQINSASRAPRVIIYACRARWG